MTEMGPSGHIEPHRTGNSGWLRAAIMGANDGILSTASLIVGVAAGGGDRIAIILAGVAGLVAGAMSMAAGEYVSVSSQADTERADIAREKAELRDDPEGEVRELAAIYQQRGLNPVLARQVADELTEKDALGAHLRDEIGITELTEPRPIQAAVVSAITFSVGAAAPLAVAVIAPISSLEISVGAATVVALAALGAFGAQVGGAPRRRAALRVVIWGVLAMLATSAIGMLVGASLG
ncbi:MAG: VIT1/CCC1 family predicted Fe2+/Mn2+ transporter [Paracoccaceae bacterium]|jgi:VIT1/CCC1 family predicted Fe2+/Mn2+ transporter